MRSKLLALRRSISVIANRRNYATGGHRCDAHMNELPVPCIPWDRWYKDKQSFYNKILLFGVAWFIFSVGMMLHTESLYLNWGPPAQPGPPSDMVEECEDADDY